MARNAARRRRTRLWRSPSSARQRSCSALPGAHAQAADELATQGSAVSKQAADERAIEATSKVTLGYVLTGDQNVDEISRLGLDGLGRLLAVRTAVEPGRPMGVNILTDEIAFFPVLYWPVLPDAKALPEETLAKIDAYMKQGGLIVFDTQDYGRGLPASSRPDRASRRCSGSSASSTCRALSRCRRTTCSPKPSTFCATSPAAGTAASCGSRRWRTSSQDQARRARVSDGVTSIIVTPNDLAAAWALDEGGRPLYPTVGGGEDQREMAFRTGINIVMHALTGNYKADQVHVPALLERLGQ